jgi:hypothetical protein
MSDSYFCSSESKESPVTFKRFLKAVVTIVALGAALAGVIPVRARVKIRARAETFLILNRIDLLAEENLRRPVSSGCSCPNRGEKGGKDRWGSRAT